MITRTFDDIGDSDEQKFDNRYNADPGLAESGSPGQGADAVDIIHPDPNESSDGDAVSVEDGRIVYDTTETNQDVDEQLQEVAEFYSGGQNAPQEEMPTIEMPTQQMGPSGVGGMDRTTWMIIGIVGLGLLYVYKRGN